MKKCRYCAEEIQDEAIKCRYCGSMLAGPDDPGPFGRSPSDGIRLEAARILNTDGKISAIKYVREKKGLGLAQAKAYVDAIGTGNPDEAARATPQGPGGGAQLLIFVLIAAGALFWLFTR